MLEESFVNKIKSHQANISIIGIGYVGLPLAVEFAKTGFNVIGVDIDESKIANINIGKSYIKDIKDDELLPLVKNGKLKAVNDFSILSNTDVIIICVPTPLNKTKDPNISFILSAVEEIKKYLHYKQLISLESTTYPGTTEELVLPKLEETGLKVGKDFYLAFSPERIDPGNKKYGVKNTPKIVGGVTPDCTEIAKIFYSQSIDNVIAVSTSKSAEMVKLLENTFRSINIGLVNEIAKMCRVLGIDVWEVIESASTKPYGFMPFYPGPGLGGHCIPIDPYYLSWKLKELNYYSRFIELAGEINSSMPEYVVNLATDALNERGKCLKDAKILVIGVAYKKDIDDLRESPSIDVIKLLMRKHSKVFYNDPYIPSFLLDDKKIDSIELSPELLSYMDCTIITTNHTCYDFQWIVDNSNLVIDTRNATKNIETGKEKVVKL